MTWGDRGNRGRDVAGEDRAAHCGLRQDKLPMDPGPAGLHSKANGKFRPLGIPTWSDKLLQEVMRSILEAYYEPQFSDHPHGFRPAGGATPP